MGNTDLYWASDVIYILSRQVQECSTATYKIIVMLAVGDGNEMNYKAKKVSWIRLFHDSLLVLWGVPTQNKTKCQDIIDTDDLYALCFMLKSTFLREPALGVGYNSDVPKSIMTKPGEGGEDRRMKTHHEFGIFNWHVSYSTSTKIFKLYKPQKGSFCQKVHESVFHGLWIAMNPKPSWTTIFPVRAQLIALLISFLDLSLILCPMSRSA